MPSLAKLLFGNRKPAVASTNAGTIKAGDQVVVRRKANRSGPPLTELKVGNVLCFSGADNEMAEVSLPQPNGVNARVTVPTASLEPVKQTFGRDSVQIDPIRRQIVRS